MKLDYVIVAGGCFWGLEDLLRSLDGVTSTKVGYSGGDFDDPTYADIITGKTGHAEAVRVEAMLPPEMVPDVLRADYQPPSEKMDAAKVTR